MNTEKKTSISFTASELEILSAALVDYYCSRSQKSETLGNLKAIHEDRKDHYEELCDIAVKLQIRTWAAQKRINK